MFCIYTEVMCKMIQLLLNKTTPYFQLLPMSKVDQGASLQYPKSHIIYTPHLFSYPIYLHISSY